MVKKLRNTRAAGMLSTMVRRIPLVFGAALALAIGLGSGTAFAFFTSSGSGSGAGNAGTPLAVTVVAASGTPSSRLVPGGSADLLVEFNNPNSHAVTITDIRQNGSTVTPVGGIGVCTTTGVSVPTQTGLHITVASGTNVLVHVPNGAQMSVSSDSGCQGATFQVAVNVTVQG